MLAVFFTKTDFLHFIIVFKSYTLDHKSDTVVDIWMQIVGRMLVATKKLPLREVPETCIFHIFSLLCILLVF